MKRAVLLVDHGSRRPEANHVLEEIAALVRSRLPDAVVETAHMELAPPSVAQAIDACVAAGATEIVVHPYFLAPGNHSRRDIPRLVAEAAASHAGLRVRVSEPLGAHPGLVEAVVDRVASASDDEAS